MSPRRIQFRVLFVACSVFALAGLARAQFFVTLNFSTGVLRDSGGAALPDNALVVLLASTNGSTTFGSLQAGGLNVGDLLNGNFQVLARTTIDSGFFGPGGAAGTTGSIAVSATASQLSAGDPLALAWFPTLTGSSFSFVTGTSYGLFTTTAPTPPDSSAAWSVPGGSGTFNLNFLTTAASGSQNPALALANLTAVPEPSTYAAAIGVAALGVAIWRRRGLLPAR